jgi:hypothetical protein
VLETHASHFHNGSAQTLLDAVQFYEGRFGLVLTPQEESDLVAFLERSLAHIHSGLRSLVLNWPQTIAGFQADDEQTGSYSGRSFPFAECSRPGCRSLNLRLLR